VQSAKNTAQSTTSLVVLLSWLMPVLTGSHDPPAPARSREIITILDFSILDTSAQLSTGFRFPIQQQSYSRISPHGSRLTGLLDLL
jgi:hypothetical protein